MIYAVFVHRMQRTGQLSRRQVYVGHVMASGAALARAAARERWPGFIRSCDYIIPRRDAGKRRKYGVGAPAPGGCGLL